MMSLVETYLAVRRASGLKMDSIAWRLRKFANFANARGETHIRADTAVAWATTASTPHARHKRLHILATFARYLRAEDPSHELPPVDEFPYVWHARPPHIYSPAEIHSILLAATQLGPAGSSRADTCWTLFGLLVATGLRIQEAMRLRLTDLTSEGLLIRETKFQKSRLVPVHESTRRALIHYCARWRGGVEKDDPLFVSIKGTALCYNSVHKTFLQIVRRLGLHAPRVPRNTSAPVGPRIHDFRHTFAVRALETCPEGRAAINRHMLALTTYLGHSSVESTYWYLHATPHLMTDLARACEVYFEGGET